MSHIIYLLLCYTYLLMYYTSFSIFLQISATSSLATQNVHNLTSYWTQFRNSIASTQMKKVTFNSNCRCKSCRVVSSFNVQANQSQAEPGWAKLSQAEPSWKVRKRFGKELVKVYGSKRTNRQMVWKKKIIRQVVSRTLQGFGELNKLLLIVTVYTSRVG